MYTLGKYRCSDHDAEKMKAPTVTSELWDPEAGVGDEGLKTSHCTCYRGTLSEENFWTSRDPVGTGALHQASPAPAGSCSTGHVGSCLNLTVEETEDEQSAKPHAHK